MTTNPSTNDPTLATMPGFNGFSGRPARNYAQLQLGAPSEPVPPSSTKVASASATASVDQGATQAASEGLFEMLGMATTPTQPKVSQPKARFPTLTV